MASDLRKRKTIDKTMDNDSAPEFAMGASRRDAEGYPAIEIYSIIFIEYKCLFTGCPTGLVRSSYCTGVTRLCIHSYFTVPVGGR